MKKRLLLFLFLTAWSIPSMAAIKVCIGPNGEKSYTNMECPLGYHLEDTLPEHERSSASLPETPIDRDDTIEPDICRNADVIYSYDIDDALQEAEKNLEKYTNESKFDKAKYWAECLVRLKKRKQIFAAETKSRKASSDPSVVLYTTSWCSYCAKARSFFRRRGITFADYDVEKDSGAARRRRKLHRGDGVPLAIINGVTILGFDSHQYERALRAEE